MDNRHDLKVILGSRVPIVVVETHDERRFLELLRDPAVGRFSGLHRPLFRWTITDGLQRIDIERDPQQFNSEPESVLRHIRSVESPGIYALLDFHPYLSEPINVRLLKDIAVNSPDGGRTLVLISHEIRLPAELERLSARFKMALPDENQRAMIVSQVVARWNKSNDGTVAVDQKAFDLLVKNLAGLTKADTETLAHNAIYADGAVSASDLPGLMQTKYELLNQKGVLSYEYETARFSDVGGLSKLKLWLEQRRRVLAEGASNLDPPKGLLLIGVQGCGKSLAAKAAAGILGTPLLRLDMGTLYNKFHGESERNLREALKQAEAMSPCVLWIDELEKGMATGTGDSGTSARILGTFLTWLAEKDQSVFVVATANDISALPPELIRKGRFDEIFFVDLPTPEVRAEILRIHLENRQINPEDFDLKKLADTCEGFSGAEIEQGIVAALYSAHADGAMPTIAHIVAEFQRTRPLSVVMAEKIQALKNWAANRTVPAD